MKPPKISVAALMGVVVLAALGFAALRSESAWVASGLQFVTCPLFATGVLFLMSGRRRLRGLLGGFGVFGLTYFFVYPFNLYTSNLARFCLPYRVLWFVHEFLVGLRNSTLDELVSFYLIGNHLLAILFGLLGSFFGLFVGGVEGEKENLAHAPKQL